MTENIKIVREYSRLETTMNTPPVDENLHVRTLRNRNILYNVRNRQIDNHNSRGQKPNIPPRQSSLQTYCNVMISDISILPQDSKNITTGNTFRPEHIPIPTPTHRHDRQDRSSSSPLQNHMIKT